MVYMYFMIQTILLNYKLTILFHEASAERRQMNRLFYAKTNVTWSTTTL